MKHPDPKKHQLVSFAKSAIRIAGYFFIPFSLETAAIVLILSEVVGVIEELVWKNLYILVHPGADLAGSLAR